MKLTNQFTDLSLANYAAINHPLSSAYPKLSSSGSRLSRALQMSSSPAAISSCSWKKPKACPNQIRYIISPVASGDTWRSLPSWTCLVNLHREAPRRHLIQMPKTPQLAPFNTKEQQVYSQLSPDVTLSLWKKVISATLQSRLQHPHHCWHLTNEASYLISSYITPCIYVHPIKSCN